MEFEAHGTCPDRLRTQRAASQARAGFKFVSSTGLAAIALLAASMGSTRARTTNWTGQFSRLVLRRTQQARSGRRRSSRS